MYETKYHRPTSVQEAASLLSGATDAKLISGGQTLVPTMKMRLASPSDLIDLRHIGDLKGVTVKGGQVTIGAATTHADVAGSSELRATCAGICNLAGMIGDSHVRHMGTIGGSIANNDPAADYPAAMMALNATINTNKRSVSADEFFTGLFETALGADEIIVSVSFSAPAKCAYAKFPNPASRYAMAGVFVSADSSGTARVGVTGAGSSGVFRHNAMEAALTANWGEAAIDGCSVDEAGLLSDIHADAAYRANLVKVMAKRAVAAA
ncbi:MAG: xanthine dehydrogenase family protein subunit M [Burkholderiaceae bacterium]